MKGNYLLEISFQQKRLLTVQIPVRGIITVTESPLLALEME
jgi:hypothetical protein